MNTLASVSIPRPEHPNPQFVRSTWRNLNGEWDFDFDFSVSGVEKSWFKDHDFSKKITVPFCPESKLSGIEFTDFIPSCWYKRTVDISEEELSGVVILHFGAVDYEAHVYINGVEAGVHKGGYSAFELNITALLHPGSNDLVVYAIDDTRSGMQPSGKQSESLKSEGPMYSRTTGIWQTVWLEFAPTQHIENVRFRPNPLDPSVGIEANVVGAGTFVATVLFDGNICGTATTKTRGGNVSLTVALSETHLWEPGVGNLYTVQLEFEADRVNSYFGLRDVQLDGYKFLINGKSVFQRLVLDQGFYPTGIYTAPTAGDLEKDILLSQKAGFNGARLHQKAFEPLYLYYCDLHGYVVWGEMASWNLDYSSYTGYEGFIPEWMEILQRDVSHPAIVGWCPFNETWDYHGRRQQLDSLLERVYELTKQYDPSRPCIDTSGNFHTSKTDIYDLHDYDQDVEAFTKRYEPWSHGEEELPDNHAQRQHCTRQMPVFISEYGGIRIADTAEESSAVWGYGEQARDGADFLERYKGLTDALLKNPKMFGFCYTQIYDVEFEHNGLYKYDRTPCVDIDAVRAINEQPAAIEEL